MDPISPSGVRVYYEILAKHLTLSGHQVSIVVPKLAPFLIHKITGIARRASSILGDEMRVLAFQFRDFLRIYFACKKMALPEIVHAQDVGSAVAAGMAFNWRCPVVLTCHYNDNPYIEILNFVLKFFLQFLRFAVLGGVWGGLGLARAC